MVMEIPLSRGLVALVDDLDYDRVAAVGTWYADKSCQTFYARKNFWTPENRRYKSIKMHRFITDWVLVDHVNGNGLDNRRKNLRPADSIRNTWNRRLRSDSRTGYKGVARLPDGRFRAYINCEGHRYELGRFTDLTEAAHAYDAAAIDMFGPFARLNFPKET